MFARFRPNINWVRAVVCPAVVFIAMNMDRGYQTDFWHHLACGREIATAGAIPNTEGIVFTVAGEPIRDPNWLTQLGYYGLFQIGGLGLVQTINALVLALAAAMLVWICRRRSGSTAIAAGVGVLAFAGIWQTLLIRPQSVSLLLFVTLYAILIEAEERRRLLVLPPILMALWANVHGGFPIGLVMIGAFLAATLAERWSAPLRRKLFTTIARHHVDGGIVVPDSTPVFEPRKSPILDLGRAFGFQDASSADAALRIRGGAGMARALALCLVACVAATLLNPYGVDLYRYVFSLSKLAAGREIEEWLPPSMNLWVGRAWAASVVAVIVLFALAVRRPRARDVFVAVCFLPLAAASVRMVPWWLLTLAPVMAMTVARNFAVWREKSDVVRAIRSPRPSLAACAMIAIIATIGILSVPALERFNPVVGQLRSSSRIESNLQAVVDELPHDDRVGQARVFTRLEWGEYLDWSGHSRRVSPFMDGRIEIYGDDLWQQYGAVSAGADNWQAILDDHGVDYLLLDKTYHAQLLPRVAASARWTPVARSGPAVLYKRNVTSEATFATARDDDDR